MNPAKNKFVMMLSNYTTAVELALKKDAELSREFRDGADENILDELQREYNELRLKQFKLYNELIKETFDIGISGLPCPVCNSTKTHTIIATDCHTCASVRPIPE